jgi:hypothetical protein
MTPAPMPDLSLSAHVAGGAVLTVPLISAALRPHTLAFDSSFGEAAPATSPHTISPRELRRGLSDEGVTGLA